MPIKYLLLILVFVPASLFAQKTLLFDIDTTDFPIVRAGIAEWNAEGQMIEPEFGKLLLKENNVTKTILSGECPNGIPNRLKRDIILLIDASSSMQDAVINDVIESLEYTFPALSQNNSVSILGYAKNPVIISPPSYIPPTLTESDFALNAGIADIEQAFFDQVSGAFAKIESWKSVEPIIIVLTDSYYFIDETDKFINTANQMGASISLIGISDKIQQEFEVISQQTGGIVVNTTTEDPQALVDGLYRIIYKLLYSKNEVCKLEYSSDFSCDPSITDITVVNSNYQNTLASSQKSFVPGGFNARLEFVPRILNFGETPPGITKNMTVNVKAISNDYGEISITTADPNIIATPSTFYLNEGEDIDITVSMTPTDSLIQYTELLFANKICDDIIIAGGGYEASPERYTIDVTQPKPQEIYLTGMDTVIAYENVGTSEVDLYLSRDKGQNWELIAENIIQSPYRWMNIEAPATDQAVIRAEIDLSNGFGFGTQKAVWQSSNHELNDIKYSPSEDLIAVAGFEIYLIDGTNASIIDTLTGSDDIILSIDFSPDGQIIAGSTINGEIILWDVSTRQIKNKTTTTFGWATDLVFTADGSKLIISYDDGKIRLHDIEDLAVVQTIEDHTARVLGLSLNLQDDFLVSISENGTVHIHRVSDWQLVETFTFPLSSYFSIVFASDNSFAALTSSNRIFIYNPLDWSQPVEIIESNSGINFTDIYFDPKGNAIVAISLDGNIHAWEKGSWKPITNFQGHAPTGFNTRGTPFSLSGTSDGRKIASAGEDGKAIIWGGLFNTQISDTTDTFSIVEPIVELVDIDMGIIPIGSDFSKTINDFIKLLTPPYVVLDSMALSDGDIDKFSYELNYSDISLIENETLPEIFHFSSDTEGFFEATLSLYYHGKIVTCNITGQAVPPQISAINPIDFGTIDYNSTVDSTIVSGIKNVGNTRITITKMEITGPQSEYFNLSEIPVGKEFAANESLEYNLSFTGSKLGTSSAILNIYDDLFQEPLQIQIFGSTPLPSVTGKVISSSGMSGRIENIDILLRNTRNHFLDHDSLYFVLEYNSSILTSVDERFFQTTNNDISSLFVGITPSDLSDEEILSVKFFAGLGDSVATYITPRPYPGALVNSTIERGIFEIDDICEEGSEARLIDTDRKLGIISVYPNPIDGTTSITLNLTEPGITNLTLFSSSGLLIEEIFNGEYTDGEMILFPEFDNLTIGIYFLRLSTQSFEQVVKVIVM